MLSTGRIQIISSHKLKEERRKQYLSSFLFLFIQRFPDLQSKICENHHGEWSDTHQNPELMHV